MKRTILLVAVLAISGEAGAADTKLAAPKQPPPPPAKVSPAVQKLRDVDTSKAAFMAALGSCPRPEVCDPKSPERNPELVKMLQGREDAFMEACAQCASDKACEQERDRIRAGRGRFGYNVCAPPKSTTAPAADKKVPAAKPAAEAKPAATK
jgi:hypothetical protein